MENWIEFYLELLLLPKTDSQNLGRFIYTVANRALTTILGRRSVKKAT
jgi:hypothetical protein